MSQASNHSPEPFADPAAVRLLGAVLGCEGEPGPGEADYAADVLLLNDAEFEAWRLRNLPTPDELDRAFVAAGQPDPFKGD